MKRVKMGKRICRAFAGTVLGIALVVGHTGRSVIYSVAETEVATEENVQEESIIDENMTDETVTDGTATDEIATDQSGCCDRPSAKAWKRIPCLYFKGKS